MDREFRPGETVPKSGIYQMRNSEDVDIRRVTCVLGEKFPPTDEPGGYFVLDTPTSEDVELPLSEDAKGG